MARPRKASAAQLVGMMVISVLVLAMTGLFGIWYSHEKAGEALARLGALSQLTDRARQAQVGFKIQVQDWKNLLLRGQEAGDHAEYRKRFADRDEAVAKALKDVAESPELPADFNAELREIVEEHAGLREKYQAALARYSGQDAATIFLVDRSVRGIDRRLNDRIDGVAMRLSALEGRRVEELRASGDELYRNLRAACVVVGLVAVASAAALAWRSLRS